MRTIVRKIPQENVDSFPVEKFFQRGMGDGQKVLIIGESPAENGWRKSGKAFYSPEGRLLASGKRLNELLSTFNLDVSKCGFTELSKFFMGKNRKTLAECCRKCWPIFEKQIKGSDFRLMISLGVITAQIIGEMLGKEIIMGEINKIEVAGREYMLLPIYHPSPISPFGREKNRKIFEKYKKEIGQLIK